MTTQTLYLIDEYLTQGGYTPGIDAETLDREAHLVAAAPDLLAALEAVTACLRGFHAADDFGPLDDEAIEAAFEAITKAKGAITT
jgi:hypothetical protein